LDTHLVDLENNALRQGAAKLFGPQAKLVLPQKFVLGLFGKDRIYLTIDNEHSRPDLLRLSHHNLPTAEDRQFDRIGPLDRPDLVNSF
jgi:hypothetical protein